MEHLPDRMTGKDLVLQENHEENIDRQLFNSMDLVERRDKRDHIRSMSSDGKKFKENYSKTFGHD